MINITQTRSLKTLLLVTCLALLLAACGDNGDNASIPEDIETKYEEAMERMIAQRMAHTGDGPVFTEEETAEFDRLKQQVRAYRNAQIEVAYQQKQRGKYQTCVENQDTKCLGLVRFTSREDREDGRNKTISFRHGLPENITYQYYFGLQGEGCESNDPVNQWTDVAKVTVRYVGKGERTFSSLWNMGKRRGQCNIQAQLKTSDIVFKTEEELIYSYRVPPNADDLIYICQDRASLECQEIVRGKARNFYISDGKNNIPVYKATIINAIPDGIAYQHYFSLTDDCDSEGPLNQWTDTNSIVVNLTRWSTHPNPTYVSGECEVSMQLKFTDADFIISLPAEKLNFGYNID